MNSGRPSVICVSLAEPTPRDCLAALQGLAFAEIRLDAMKAAVEDMAAVFSGPSRLIATFRPQGSGAMTGTSFDDDVRKTFLSAAIEAGAAYVDIEADSALVYRQEIIEKAHRHGCKVIISHHDYEMTPDRNELERIANLCFDIGADIAKIAFTCVSESDGARLLGLLENSGFKGRLVVVGMGEKGKITRIAAPFLGSPFTFASSAKGKETAPGQIDRETLEKIMEMVGYDRAEAFCSCRETGFAQ